MDKRYLTKEEQVTISECHLIIRQEELKVVKILKPGTRRVIRAERAVSEAEDQLRRIRK